MYKTIEFTDKSFRRLASNKLLPDKKQTGIIYINSEVTPEIFINYFLAESTDPSPSSLQKLQVIKKLRNLGWSVSKIKHLTRTQRLCRRFLTLHEISHLNHRDNEIYYSTSPEEKIEIETRACIEALKQLQHEENIKKNHGHY